jgi:hypothetical protein
MKGHNHGGKGSAVDTGGHKGSEHIKQQYSYAAMKSVFRMGKTCLQAVGKHFQGIL